ncbi:hypothetical protein SI65_09459 [Aspergillus cristatus]|uniref:glucose oxidase n=1 Tax=Aspergillus cristatus TaxID=573508 RepID=A0A1E3B2N8_ASPCR|nr:hypothetical protein SI65_09459 [Aspergillus cristatus]
MLFFWLFTLLTAALAAEYAYIVVEGGTSGLIVANRLSEDPSTSVLVIEAGSSVYDNINVTDIDRLAYTYDSPIDWAYKSIPQEYGGHFQVLHASQALGGTSVMNELIVRSGLRTNRVRTNGYMGELGNDGWTWDNLFPYYLKSENMSAPNQTQAEAGASIEPTYNNREGLLHVGFLNIKKQENNLTTALNRTLDSMGVPSNPDLNTGHMRGFTIHPSTVDVSMVSEVMLLARTTGPWKHHRTGDDITAAGVEIKTQNGEEQLIRAKKEVILAAGALRSPAILELSGVGNLKILKQHGIPVRTDLPSVGENLQDQLNTSIVVSTNTPVTGTRTVAFASASDIFGSSLASVAASIFSQLPHYASATAAMSNGAMKASDLQKLFEIQHDQIFNKKVSIVEFVFILEGAQSIHTGYWNLLPFARGNSHITSANPEAAPVVNPNYGMLEWDTQIQVAMSKFLRRIYRTDTPNHHVIGTASMLPRSMGGVVDNRLKVYGTTNVRVVDATIQPMQLSGHPMANLYAIAEWVSDMIKETEN